MTWFVLTTRAASISPIRRSSSLASKDWCVAASIVANLSLDFSGVGQGTDPSPHPPFLLSSAQRALGLRASSDRFARKEVAASSSDHLPILAVPQLAI